ncbi:MAG: hypothetical protein QOE44_938 [Solirubrobacteraceae bacterium]|jgi:hypothetical protein|nr:hypothetical protein [Solirubrobacteraceae bacterium]
MAAAPENLAPAAPATRPCVRCGVEINAASGFCTLCGSTQRVRSRRARRLMAAGGLVGLAAAAALVVVVLGGGSGARGGSGLHLYRSAELSVLVPDGWTGGRVVAPAEVARVVYVDPVDTRRRVSVTAERMVTVSARRRARLARAQARSRGDYRERFFGRVLFPDDRPAWLLTYDTINAFRAVYVYSACVPTVGMTVEVDAANIAELKAAVKQIPASAAPVC